jgi:SAF domain
VKIQERTGAGAGRSVAPAQPSVGDRLPTPPRERKPALAALAVLLIVGGALASGLIVLRAGERSDYLVVKTTVDPGQQISAADLGLAHIAGSGAGAIPARRRAEVIGSYATTRIFPGTLITTRMVTAARPEIPDGSAVVGAVLSSAQRPAARLRRGDLVTVLSVPRSDNVVNATATVLLDRAEVVAVADAPTNGSLAVSLLVPQSETRAVSAAAASGTVAVALLPGVAQPGTGAGASSAPPASPTAPAGSPTASATSGRTGPGQVPQQGQPSRATQTAAPDQQAPLGPPAASATARPGTP